jgi:hypothetical protein
MGEKVNVRFPVNYGNKVFRISGLQVSEGETFYSVVDEDGVALDDLLLEHDIVSAE